MLFSMCVMKSIYNFPKNQVRRNLVPASYHFNEAHEYDIPKIHKWEIGPSDLDIKTAKAGGQTRVKIGMAF